MNVFVLSTGRCGSYTFAKACSHIVNYTVAHEPRAHLLLKNRFAYPENHIEVDNRLSWMLARLDLNFGGNKDVFFVHLRRNTLEVARSMVKRRGIGIQQAYEKGGLMGEFREIEGEPLEIFIDYCRTVNTNIEYFLRDKRKMNFSLENAKEDFRRLWLEVGARGDEKAALAEWDVAHNASPIE